MTNEPKKPAPMRHCFYCGEPLGRYRDHDPLDTCGASECLREARAIASEQRDAAHEQLDRDLGWGDW
jgi:hypothetical protein